MSRSISFGLAIALAFAACGPRVGSGPAWPTPQDPEEDGGESLAPRESVATVESDDDDVVDKAAEEEVAKPAADKAETPAVTAPIVPTTPVVEEPPITEEIVIEIEE